MNVWAKGSVAVSAVAVLVLVMAIATAPADQAAETSGCNRVSLRRISTFTITSAHATWLI